MALTNEDLLAISEIMDKKLQPVNDRLDAMDQKFEAIDQRFEAMDQRLDAMDQRFDRVDDTLKILKFNQEHMSEKLKGIEVTMNYNDYHLSHDMKKLQDDVDTIVEILKIHDMIPVAK